jgi:MFS family permease
MVGVLLCAYQVGFLLFAPAIGNLLPKIGHKNSLLYGLAVMALSTCLYSVGSFFENDGLFYGISYFGRLF